MNTASNKIYQTFSEKTKSICFLNSVSIILILVFFIGPFKLTGYKHTLLKMLIIIILGFSLYINYNSSNDLLDIQNIFTNPSLANVKYNYVLNQILSLFILILIIYIIYPF
jgi:hypothetical protein